MREIEAGSIQNRRGRVSWRLITIAVGLGCALSLASLPIWHGWAFTLSWILGAESLEPTSSKIASAWWLGLGILLWLSSVPILRSLGSSARLKIAALLAGPTTAMLCLLDWNLSLVFYGWGAWRIDNNPSGLRWVLDGPVMSVWYRASNAILDLVRAPGPIEPIHFVDGSTVGHMPPSLIGLGILNGAMLALVLATLVPLSIGVLQRVSANRGSAA